MTINIGRGRIVAVVPIRSFRNGKLRLSSVLNGESRASLLRTTAEGVTAAARASNHVGTVLVVSSDDEVLAWAARIGPEVVALEQPAEMPGLNGAISAGRSWALNEHASAVLSLFADLPFLTANDIEQLVSRPEPVVFGPDRRGEGTNALLLRLAGNGSAFRFAFGAGSLSRHLEEARRLQLAAGTVRSTGLAFDLDTPQDLAEFMAACGDQETGPDALCLPCGAGIA